MRLEKIRDILEADMPAGEDMLDMEISSACGSDMMSDVLALLHDQAILLTGLVNPQVIRTSMMMDMHCIVFVRGKQPTPEMVELAKENKIALLTTKLGMFKACGKLYTAGLANEVV